MRHLWLRRNVVCPWFRLRRTLVLMLVFCALWVFTSIPSRNSSLHSLGIPRLPEEFQPEFASYHISRNGSFLPKVALLFLSRGSMPLEPIWRYFFDAFPFDWEQYFSVYIHFPPNFKGLEPSSIFAGHEIQNPVNVVWGQHSMVDAERKLYEAAFEDPRNWQFVLLSDDSMPLYSAATTYFQFLAEKPRSRINICRNESDPEDRSIQMVYRWQRPMEKGGLTQDLWRKSGQWSSLLRPHVEVVLKDKKLNEIFEKECWAKKNEQSGKWYRFCISDEHYIPSLFAITGYEGSEEFACDGVATHTFWPGNVFHPKIYSEKDATMATMRQIFRKEKKCLDGNRNLNDVDITTVLQEWKSYVHDPGNGDLQGLVSNLRRQYEKLSIEKGLNLSIMPPQCPLFARKIDTNSVEAWLSVFKIATAHA